MCEYFPYKVKVKRSPGAQDWRTAPPGRLAVRGSESYRWYDWLMAEYAKVSVTLPSPLLERIRAQVGPRGVSRYVAQALEAEEQRAALRAWLEAQETEHGPIPADLLAEVRSQWLGEGPARG